MAVKMLQLMLVLSTIAVTSIMAQRNIGLSGPEFRNRQLGQNPDLLQFAAMTGETVLIIVDSAEVLAVVQENVNLNMNCLPWLQRFPGAQLRWLFQAYDPDFMMPTGSPGEIAPGVPDPRRTVGGEYNHWLNITRTIIVPGAEDPDTGVYTCEACYFLGDPIREECHQANVTLQGIGGPPFIDKADSPDEGEVAPNTYRIGADFCIPPDFNGVLTLTCSIPNSDANVAFMMNISQAFPTPARAWFQDGDLLYRDLITTSPAVMLDYFMMSAGRMLLAADAVVPAPLFPDSDGRIVFNTQVMNATRIETLSGPAFEAGRVMVRSDLIQAITGTWRCEANNTFGSDSATSTIRICGNAPMLPGCPGGPGVVLFPNPGDVVNVGCTVCIPQGTVITLDCSGASTTAVSYEWRDSNDQLVSSMARLTTTIADNYTCSATNIDNPTELMTTVLAYTSSISFTSQVTEQSVSQPRRDNGCSRLRNQTGLENVDACVFLGETLDFACSTADTMAGVMISAPGGSMGNETLRVVNVTTADEGTYGCRLTNVDGVCRGATINMEVRVFDPARIIRQDLNNPVCSHYAGRQGGDIFQPGPIAVTLCCPFDGIETPSTAWYRVSVDDNGCAREDLIQSGGNFTISNPSADILALSFMYMGDSSTYVCRTSNNAGADADTVSLRSAIGEDWRTTDFSSCDLRCRDGVQTRGVMCRSSIDGMLLPDTECDPDLRPNNTQSCADDYPAECLLDPVWISGEWTQCFGGGCGGWRFRSVQCQVPMTGEVRADYACRGYPKPQDYDFEGCRRECCIEDKYPTRCRSMGAGYCADEAFSKECCWTCGRKTIGG